MCGISVLLRTDDSEADLSELLQMSALLRHRGPDGSGYARLDGGRLLFGHVRLSVIDVEGGAQPLFNEDGSVCLVFNGEVYDHEALRERLERQGHRFRTRSDAEVVLHLYEQHGVDLLTHLDGEYAFALWDDRRKRLLAARDRFGLKPLFHASHRGRFLIASEAKAILGLPEFPRRISADFLGGPLLRSMNSALTPFDGIHSLRPAHHLLVEPGHPPREARYWRPAFDVAEELGFDEACAGVRSRLERAVRRRMVADVPVVAYLSGGLDSTVICHEMVRTAKPARFFTVGFADPTFDESTMARNTGDHLGVPVEVVSCPPARLADELERTVWHTEMPFANASSIAKQVLSACVREHGYKVSLTGEGADELFGGYAYFKLEALWREMARGGAAARRARALWRRFRSAERRSEGFLWQRGSRWRSGQRRFGYPNVYELNVAAGERMLPYLYATDAIDRLGGGPASHVAREFDVAWLRGQHPFNATRVVALASMANYLIPRVCDRVEMANSLECRTPFLDIELAEYVLRLPPGFFLDLPRLREKHVLREAYADVLPPRVANAGKQPFLAPAWRTLATTRAGRDLIDEHLRPAAVERAGVFDPRFVGILLGAWRLVPARLPLATRLDAAVGVVLTQQIVSRTFVERAPRGDGTFETTNRSWGAAP